MFKTGGQFLLQSRHIAGLGIPVHEQRFDFRAEKVVRTARAEFGQTRRVLGIDETQNLFVILHRANEALLLRHLSAQPRQYRGKRLAAGHLWKCLIFLTAESTGVTSLGLILRLDEGGGSLDAFERIGVTGLFIIVP